MDEPTDAPERAAGKPMRLRLYILSNTASSEAAITNLNAVAETYRVRHFELEVIDVRDEPLRALNEGVLMVPLLILTTDKGECELVGDLSDTEVLLKAFGLNSPRKA